MAATKLSLYNGALRKLGQRRLASLSVEDLSRRTLDDIWDDGLVDFCLEQGQWGFVTRASQLEASVDVEPDFGYRYAYAIPSDFKSIVAICTDGYFINPLIRYSIEAGYIYSDCSEIYLKYISSDITYGYDFSTWSAAFVDFVETVFAYRTCPIIAKSDTKEKKLKDEVKETRLIARNNDMQNKPPVKPAMGSWAIARLRANGNRDRTLNTIRQ